MLSVVVFSLVSAAASTSHFYYSVAETDAPGWEYVLPACKPLDAAEYEKMSRDCTKLDAVSEKCPTSQTVNLKHVAAAPTTAVRVSKTDKDVQKVDETTKTFKLSFLVFTSEKQCHESRAKASATH